MSGFGLAGTASYTVAEPVGVAPKDHGVGRRCCMEKCCADYDTDKNLAGKLNRYATESRDSKGSTGYLLCEACLRARARDDVTIAEYVKGRRALDKTGTKRGVPAGKSGTKPRGLALTGLRQAIAERGFTMVALAEEMDSSIQYISGMCAGRFKASEKRTEKIAGILGCSVVRLTGEREEGSAA